jgi:dihydrolipoamide dehydrogenase
MLKFKDEAIEGNTKGIAFLLKKNKIDAYHGTGKILGAGKVEVTPEKGVPQVLETKNICIATGSDVARLPGIEIDEKTVVSSTGALELDKVPGQMVVVGAGVIGLELGSVWRRLGAKVHGGRVPRPYPAGHGPPRSPRSSRCSLKRQGMAFKLGSKVTGVGKAKKDLKVSVEPAKGGDGETIEADIVLVAIGRVPYTAGLGLEEAGVKTDDRGRVEIDDHFKTNVDGIYAIGDVVRGAMLAHKAEEEGVALAELLAGQAGHVNYGIIPGVVYTAPEVASVGKTEDELKEAGIDYKTGNFPFMANGRAKANKTTDGFVKVLADAKTDQVLGVHIVGPQAGELIHECAVLMEFGGSSEDLARTCHAHPTLSEAVKEAALAVDKRAIHS